MDSFLSFFKNFCYTANPMHLISYQSHFIPILTYLAGSFNLPDSSLHSGIDFTWLYMKYIFKFWARFVCFFSSFLLLINSTYFLYRSCTYEQFVLCQPFFLKIPKTFQKIRWIFVFVFYKTRIAS